MRPPNVSMNATHTVEKAEMMRLSLTMSPTGMAPRKVTPVCVCVCVCVNCPLQ